MEVGKSLCRGDQQGAAGVAHASIEGKKISLVVCDRNRGRSLGGRTVVNRAGGIFDHAEQLLDGDACAAGNRDIGFQLEVIRAAGIGVNFALYLGNSA